VRFSGGAVDHNFRSPVGNVASTRDSYALMLVS
jgi:hypothetical protein